MSVMRRRWHEDQMQCRTEALRYASCCLASRTLPNPEVHRMMPSLDTDQAELLHYLEQHSIAQKVESFLQCLLKHRPDDPGRCLELAKASITARPAAVAAAIELLTSNAVASPVGSPRGGAGHQHANKLQVARAQDGLLQVDFRKANLIADSAMPLLRGLTLGAFLRAVPLPTWEGMTFIHCPHCSRVISDSLSDHWQAEHPDQPGPTEYPAVPTTESVLALAKAFVKERGDMHRSCDDSPPSEEQVLSIHIYTQETPIYRYINYFLRTGAGDIGDWGLYAQYLQHALDAIPAYTGSAYRGIDVAVDESLYIPGNIVTWRAFSSSSTNVRVARDFLGRKRTEVDSQVQPATLFIISCVSGRPIDMYSAIQAEDEVFAPIHYPWGTRGWSGARRSDAYVGCTATDRQEYDQRLFQE